MSARLALALAFSASFSADAAACHLHAVWRFPWPQHCPTSHFATLRLAPARTALDPRLSAPVDHAEALELLKRSPEEPAWLPILK